MPRTRLDQSVVTRLVVGLVLGGLLASAGLSALELRRTEPALQMEITQEVTLTTRNLQAVLRGLMHNGTRADLTEALNVFSSGGLVQAVRLQRPGAQTISLGHWPANPESIATVWPLAEHGFSTGREVSIQRPTYVQAPFEVDRQVAELDLLVDGPAARRQMHTRLFSGLLMQWLCLAVLVLLGLLMLRRWVAGPLSEIMDLVRDKAGPDPFHRFAAAQRGEFAQLGQAIGRMLDDIETTSMALREREQAFESLYQFAPAAMVSLSPAGRVIAANQRAAHLLGVADEKQLIDRPAMDLVVPEDRALMRQTIDRLDLDETSRCDLRLAAEGKRIDAVVECSVVRDDEGLVRSVRLSLQDVSEAKQLQRKLAEQTQLLNLLIDHMSDAILLVNSEGRIAAHNQKLATLLQCGHQRITGLRYDPQTFWVNLGVQDADLFASRMNQIEADDRRPAQERFETRVGTFLFQGIPVQDATHQIVGRLWVVQETTPLEQNQRLLEQQTQQLQSLKHLGRRLQAADTMESLLHTALEQVYAIMGVEAAGIAIRRSDGDKRAWQLLHRGPQAHLLSSNRALLHAIETRLMPQVLERADVAFWPDLPKTLAWAPAFTAAGLTCLAAGPLHTDAESQGVLWIARRGGERLERHQLYLLETLTPLLSARIETTQLNERLRMLEFTDPVTGLPNRDQFQRMCQRLIKRPGRPWAVAMLNLDRFRELNQTISHDQADQVLRDAARAITALCRRHCFVSRLAGATFGVLTPGYERDEALALAQRLREQLGRHRVNLPDGSVWSVTTSVGLACEPHDAIHGTSLIELAQTRMLLAKQAGCDRVIADASPNERQVG